MIKFELCPCAQVKHADDSFLTLTTDGINFLLSDQEICDIINKCADPTEAADVINQQVGQKLVWFSAASEKIQNRLVVFWKRS